MKKILVTGGAGYVGAVLVPKLLRQGYSVRVLDLFMYADESVFAKAWRQKDQLELLQGDLRDFAAIERSLDRVDAVIHLAGISNDPSSDLNPQLTRDVNISATCNLIDAAREHGVERFINASSSSVYGIKQEAEVTEELSLEPLTVYSESKVAIEKYLREARGPMAAVSIRSATVCGYSPRMRLDLTVNILTHHAVTRGKITVFGGEQKRPNIHIEDITDLYTFLLETPRDCIDGKELNACGANHTVAALAELVRDTVAPGVPIETAPTSDLRSYHISGKRIRDLLGFVPKRSIADAIRDVAAAFQQGMIPEPNNDQYYNVRVMKARLASPKKKELAADTKGPGLVVPSSN